MRDGREREKGAWCAGCVYERFANVPRVLDELLLLLLLTSLPLLLPLSLLLRFAKSFYDTHTHTLR